jgi:hypothetical protein
MKQKTQEDNQIGKLIWKKRWDAQILGEIWTMQLL